MAHPTMSPVRRGQSRTLPRRTLIRAAGLGAAGLGAVWLACGDEKSSKPSSAGGQAGTAVVGTVGAAATGEAKRGGTLTTYISGLINRAAYLDVASNPAIFGVSAYAGVYSNVVQWDWYNGGKIAPDLAEKWEITDGGSRFVFTLRKNVKWHDGKPFSSEDVKFNIERATAGDYAPRSPIFGAQLRPALDSVQAPDESTLVLKLKQPFSITLDLLANTNGRVLAKHVLSVDKAWESTFVGTGPFRLTRLADDNIVEWQRNPDYFIPGLPYLDSVQKFIITDKTAQVAALGSGRVMINTAWPALLASEQKLIKDQGGDRLLVSPSQQNALSRVNFNTLRKPFADGRVRQAVQLTLDRNAIRSRIYEGAGVWNTLDPRIYKDYALPQAEIDAAPGFRSAKDQDLADAKRLLSAAGYPDGVDFDILALPYGDWPALLQVVAQQLQKVGLRGKVNVVEFQVGQARRLKGDWDMGNNENDGYIHDPFFTLNEVYINDVSQGPFDDTEMTSMINEGFRTFEEPRRKELALKFQRKILEQPARTTGIVWMDSSVILDKRVKNYAAPADMNQDMDFTKVWLSG